MLETPFSASTVADVTTQTFASDVLQASREKPVLVDFWAPWCGPCKQLGPMLERAAKTAGDKVRIVKMNIDEHPAVAGQLGIQSIPAVIAFSNGQPVDGFMGALQEEQIRSFIERLVGPLKNDTESLVLAAKQALDAEDLAGAAQMYALALEQDETNIQARAGLAQIQLRAGQAETAKATIEMVPLAKRSDPAVVAILAEIALTGQVKGLGDVANLMAKIETDPLDHAVRYDLALALAAQGKRTEAAGHLLDIVRSDRDWNEDGARKQLVQFFDAWGPTDPATLDGRRRLSSILFA